ncbi:MAG: hypothetical protein ACQEXJ_13730 [Myxococcota bacterium]
MHVVSPPTRALAAALLLVVMATPPARSETPRWARDLGDRLPLAARVAPDLDDRPEAELRSYRRALLARLHLGEGRAAVEAPRDLHDAVLLAALSARLREETPEQRRRAATAAWLVHAAGVAFERDGRLHAAVERLPEAAETDRSRALFEDLARSAAGLRDLSREWFPQALHGALDDEPDADDLHHLRGLWLEREGRVEDAAYALLRTVTLRATVPRSLDLTRILARAGREADARHVAKRLEARAPGAEGPARAILRAAEDRAATRAFEDAARTPGVSERIRQVARYHRLERPQAEGALAEALLRESPDDRRVQGLTASVWVRQARLGRLHDLLAEVSSEERPLPRRLLEARIAGAVMARLAAARGLEEHPLGEEDLEADLARLSKLDGERGRRLEAELGPLLAATEHPDDEATLRDEIRDLAEREGPVEERRVRVIAASWLAAGRPDRAMGAVQRLLPAARPADRAQVGLLLAGLEVAYGATRGDRGLLARGQDRLDGLRLHDPGDEALRRHHETVGRLVAAWSAGRAPDEDALGALLPLVDRLDPTRPARAEAARAVAMSAAALAMAGGDREMGVGALQVARRAGPRDAIGLLAAGLVAMSVEDAAGALTWLGDARERASTARLRFIIHKWRSLAANREGRTAEMSEDVAAMGDVWDAVDAPDRKDDHRPWPVMAGAVEIAVAMEPGEPLDLRVELLPLVALVADFPHDRARLEGLTSRRAGGDGGGTE